MKDDAQQYLAGSQEGRGPAMTTTLRMWHGDQCPPALLPTKPASTMRRDGDAAADEPGDCAAHVREGPMSWVTIAQRDEDGLHAQQCPAKPINEEAPPTTASRWAAGRLKTKVPYRERMAPVWHRRLTPRADGRQVVIRPARKLGLHQQAPAGLCGDDGAGNQHSAAAWDLVRARRDSSASRPPPRLA